MDFLEIRKKAKERARAREAEEAAARVQGAAREERRSVAEAPQPDSASPPADAPVVTEEDVVQGALAARLQGLPPPDTAAQAAGPFRTWRPGAGSPPVAPEPARPIDPGITARPEDFALVSPSLRPDPVARPLERAREAPADPLDEFFYREDEAGPAVPVLAPAEPEPEGEGPVLAREEFLTFLLGAEEFAVAIEQVREVVRSPPVTEVPRAPSHILGVVTVRGEVIAVIDPRRRLGLAAPPDAEEGAAKIVIVDAGEGHCGLRVDRVASVVRLRPGSIEPCPQGIAGQRAEFIAGIGREGDRLFTVLDVAALLRRGPGRAEERERRADADA